MEVEITQRASMIENIEDEVMTCDDIFKDLKCDVVNLAGNYSPLIKDLLYST